MSSHCKLPICHLDGYNYPLSDHHVNYPASAAGVGIKGGVGGESVSCTSTAIGSHVAGPITMKLSGIDQGNSVSVLGRVRGRMIQDS